MLDTQYRMHPSISRFPSAEFYNHKLQDGIIDAQGQVPTNLRPPTSMHLKRKDTGHQPSLIFLDHNGNESMRDRSRVNWNEAHIVCSIVEDLLLNNEVGIS
jgi:superfamily I DNA and/or RNA helicase